ncbi:hypothetical protein F2M64_09170 [Campylobacter coli]|nr:hypothetical protein [Campylobacter coli]
MKLSEFDFRVWDKHHKGCGNKDCKCQTKYVYGEEAKTRLSEFKEDCEIELFTGLYDKNGNKIYENDIVEYHENEALIIKYIKGTFYTCQDYEKFMKKYECQDNKDTEKFWLEEAYKINNLRIDDNNFIARFEIIGNIHENAELLKVKDDEAEENDIFFKGNMIVWLFGNYYSVYEVVKAYEESYIISDLMGRQIEIDPRVAMNGGYKDAKDDLFLWYFEVMENEEIKIYPKKLTYNQMLEECKKNDIYIIKPLYSLGYTYNNNREDFKNYN